MWENYLKILPKLSAGAHQEGSGSLCAMEMVAYMEGLPHSDAPPCTCPVLASFVRAGQDGMDDAARQRLLPYLPMLVDTVNPDIELDRAKFLADAANTRFVPMAGNASSEEIWDEFIKVLVEAIELDPNRVVPVWSPEKVEQLIKEFA